MRFLGYFFLVFVVLMLLRQAPFVGELFRVPLLGFFLSAAVVSALVARGGQKLTERRIFTRAAKDFGEVDTPQRRGKLGRLLLQSGRAKEAVEHLTAAVEGEPDVVEWLYRLGMAQRETGDAASAVRTLTETIAIDERHSYGDALMQLGLAQLDAGDADAALVTFERCETLEGPTPKQMYHKGRVLKALGRKAEARECFGRLPKLVQTAPQYQKSEARAYGAKAFWARF